MLNLFFLITETLHLIIHLRIYITNYRENKSRINMDGHILTNSSNSIETALMREDTNSYDSSGQ